MLHWSDLTIGRRRRRTSSNVKDYTVAIAWEELFFGGTSAAVHTIPVKSPDVRHEDPRDLMGSKNEKRVLQNRDQGGHKGRLNCGSGVL